MISREERGRRRPSDLKKLKIREGKMKRGGDAIKRGHQIVPRELK